MRGADSFVCGAALHGEGPFEVELRFAVVRQHRAQVPKLTDCLVQSAQGDQPEGQIMVSHNRGRIDVEGFLAVREGLAVLARLQAQFSEIRVGPHLVRVNFGSSQKIRLRGLIVVALE